MLLLMLFASISAFVQTRFLGSKKLNSLIDSTGLSHKFTVDKSLGWAVQWNRCGTSWGLTPQSGHLGSTVGVRRFWYEFKSRQCPERSWDRVVLCGLLSVSSSKLIGGGRLCKTLLGCWLLIARVTASVCTAWSVSFFVAASSGWTVG